VARQPQVSKSAAGYEEKLKKAVGTQHLRIKPFMVYRERSQTYNPDRPGRLRVRTDPQEALKFRAKFAF